MTRRLRFISGRHNRARPKFGKRHLSYNQRLLEYEKEKGKLQLQVMRSEEYEAAIKQLAKKWKI